jgi:group I intron endonuclease
MATGIVGGIYKIENTVNGKCYIGSTKNIASRWRNHKSELGRGKHRNLKIQRSCDKHGLAAFKFHVVELVESPSDLAAREQFWMDAIHPWYNIAPLAGGNKGVVPSAATRQRLSFAASNRSPEVIERMRAAALCRPKKIGVPHTDESKAKIAAKARERGARSEATKEKLRQYRLDTKASDATKLKMSKTRTGQVRTEAEKQAMSDGQKLRWAKAKQQQAA